MDNQRLILFLALSFILFLGWQAWQKDYAPAPVALNGSNAAMTASASKGLETPNDVPMVQTQQDKATKADTPAAPVTGMEATGSSQRIHVVTDNLDVIIDTRGGDIRQEIISAKSAELFL